MTGQELYELYIDTMYEVARCSADDWDDLSESDKTVWEAFAKEVKRA